MHEKKWADQALKSFDDVVGAMPGFRNRGGQRKMAAQVAQTFSQAQLGKNR
jgi:ATP-dependent DNA helicase DinG